MPQENCIQTQSHPTKSENVSEGGKNNKFEPKIMLYSREMFAAYIF